DDRRTAPRTRSPAPGWCAGSWSTSAIGWSGWPGRICRRLGVWRGPTSAVPGVAMSDLPARSVPGAVTSLGRFLGRVHAVRRESCPFERWLSVTVPIARLRVDRGLVDTEDFDHERDGRAAPDLLDELVDGRPRAEELELGDLVVCHGDACLPNFLLDPDSLAVTGMIDVHRLGVAD